MYMQLPEGADLDEFLHTLYRHKMEDGFWAGLARRVANLLALPVLGLVVVGAIGFVRWHELLTCSSSNDQGHGAHAHACAELITYLDPMAAPWTPRKVFGMVQLVLFGVWWVMALVSLVPFVATDRAVALYCAQVLGLTDNEVATLPWPAIVRRLALVQAGSYGGACGRPGAGGTIEQEVGQVPPPLTQPASLAYILCRIFRAQNYWTALYATRALRTWRWGPGFLDLEHSRVLFVVLDWAVVADTARRDFVDRGPAALRSVSAVRGRVWAAAFGLAVAMPFVLPLFVCSFLLKSMQEVHAKQGHVRAFTHAAAWACRDFHEARSCLNARLARSMYYGVAYLGWFVQPVGRAVGSVLVLVAGVALGLLVGIGLVDEEILAGVTLGSHNLLWYMGVLTVVVAASQVLAPVDGGGVFASPDNDSARAAYDKFFGRNAARHNPNPHWGWASRSSVNTVRAMIPYKALGLVRELGGVLAAPLVLMMCTLTTTRVQCLVQCLASLTVHHLDLGHVCAPAAQAVGLAHLGPDALGTCDPVLASKVESAADTFAAHMQQSEDAVAVAVDDTCL